MKTISGAAHDRFLREHATLLGIAWRKYRRRQSRRGLEARLVELGLGGDLPAYGELLRSDPGERERLIEAMRVTVSRFYRDPKVWRGLEEIVLPQILDRLGARRPLQVWSAGCASGEEPYSVAILWSRLPSRLVGDHELRIVATDVDPAVLERARRGLYPEASLRSVPPPLADHFEICEEGLRVRDALRRGVTFERIDLLTEPPPLEQCDLLFCRYLVLTYYRGSRLRKVFDELAGVLSPGGALVVGQKEPLPPEVAAGCVPWEGAPAVFRVADRGTAKGRDGRYLR